MRKEFIVSKIEASQDGSPYVYVVFTDPNGPKSAGGHAGRNFPQSPFGVGVDAVSFSSTEDLMKKGKLDSTSSSSPVTITGCFLFALMILSYLNNYIDR